MLGTESVTDTLTVTDAALFGGMLGAMFGTVMLFALIFYVLMVIANWKIFEKAGEKGWKALIPIYNTYIMYKIVKMQNWFWAILAISFSVSLTLTINGYSFYATTAQEIAARNEVLANNPILSVLALAALIVPFIAAILYAIRTAKVFGKSGLFAVGLFFFTPIFWMILAFGKANYDKKRLKK